MGDSGTAVGIRRGPRGRCGDPRQDRRSPRYNSAVRHAFTFAVAAAVILGCGTPPDPKQPTGAGSPTVGGGTGGTGGAKPPGPGKGGGGKPGAPDPTPKDIACLVPTCVYHAGAGAYFACQSSGAGTCFHFGPPCTPSGACMYDAASRGYKQCTKVAEGTCAAWGAACAPASKCMFNPADNLHHTCEDVSGGGCKRYGALCAP